MKILIYNLKFLFLNLLFLKIYIEKDLSSKNCSIKKNLINYINDNNKIDLG